MIINHPPQKVNPNVCVSKLTHMLADYYFSGLPVFPVRIDKTPTVRWTKAAAGQTFAEFANMLSVMDCDAVGIGFALGVGQVPLVARDYDRVDGYDNFCRQHPELAKKLPVVKSHRGHHVYFRPERPIRTQRFNDGELRSTGSYVVMPPSLHLSGDCYTWLNPLPLDIAEVPLVDPNVRIDFLGWVVDNHGCPLFYPRRPPEPAGHFCYAVLDCRRDTYSAKSEDAIRVLRPIFSAFNCPLVNSE